MDRSDHNIKVGLLGGSFNPAHKGHVELSLSALDFLDLDYIWWLVSPANPLKDESELAPYAERMQSARSMIDNPRIIISDMEKDFDTRYTIDTLERIKTDFPSHHFVWLMGADNLIQFDKWKDWRRIADTVPFAIFTRPSYSRASLDSLAAKTLKDFRIKTEEAHSLHRLKPPAWVFCELTQNPASSTKIRSNTK